MSNYRRFTIRGAVIAFGLVAAACGTSAPEPSSREEPTGQARLAATAADTYPGYVLTQDKSSFDPADVSDVGTVSGNALAVRTYSDLGMTRMSGPRGVFSTSPTTGVSTAAGSPDVLQSFKPFGSTLAAHNDEVRAYFIAAGLPQDQMGSVQGGTQLTETGLVNDWQNRQSRVSAYTTFIGRTINGVSIRNSGAFARLADSGKPVAEAVFWPAVPKSAVDQAAAWKASLTPDAEAAFRAKLPADIDWSQATAEVVVVHQSARWNGSSFAMASYDVGTPQGGRHFGSDGTEFRTPEEQ